MATLVALGFIAYAIRRPWFWDAVTCVAVPLSAYVIHRVNKL
jgi:hypothetical protein